MSSSGGESGVGADVAALGAELASQSLSKSVPILPVDAALQAIATLTQQGRRLENWEGWVKLPDGGHAKSLSHGGSFALPSDAARAAQVASDGIRRAQASWNRNPEYPGAALYIGLTFAAR